MAVLILKGCNFEAEMAGEMAFKNPLEKSPMTIKDYKTDYRGG